MTQTPADSHVGLVGDLADLYLMPPGLRNVEDIVLDRLGPTAHHGYDVTAVNTAYLAAVNALLAPAGLSVDGHSRIHTDRPIEKDDVRELIDDAFDLADLDAIAQDHWRTPS